MSKDFEARLREQAQAALLPEVHLGRYMHIERMGNEEVDGLTDGEVLIQTKIDGSNLTVAWYDGPIGLVVASRNFVVYRNGGYVEFPTGWCVCHEARITECPGPDPVPKTERRFSDAVEYVLKHDGIQTLAARGLVLRGEWLIQHSVPYAKDKYGHFYLFDVQYPNGQYVHPDEWIPWAQELGIRYIPISHRLLGPTISELADLTKGPDEFGAEQKEGIVIKRYNFTNKFGRMTWGKMVSADFRRKMKAAMGTTPHDPPEVRFVSDVITHGFIMKTIHTLEDNLGRKLIVRDMPAVLGIVWFDAFREGLWDFVKEEKVKTFDFQSARKIANDKVRDIAMAYFNGLPTVWDHDVMEGTT